MKSAKPFFKSFSLIIVILTQAQPTLFGAEMPQQVKRLTEMRQEAINKINDTFINELEKIKINYTKKGDLENANLVAELIKTTKGSDGSEALSLDGKWKYRTDGQLVSVMRRFEGNKMFDEGGIKRDCVFENGGVTIFWSSRSFEKLIIDPKTPDVLKGTSNGGGSFTYTRVK